MTVPIAASAAEVSVGWLTDALEAGGVAQGSTVVDFTADSVGTGQMGDNVRFDLVWTDPINRPGSVVAKFASVDPTSRATGSSGGYQREVRFYQELADTVEIRTPRCYHAGIDVQTGDFDLLMEDLAPRHQGDQMRGCSADEAGVVLDQLVLLQVPRWNDPTLDAIDWLPRSGRPTGPTVADLYTLFLPGFMDRLGHRLDQQQIALAERFSARIEAWVTLRPAAPMVVVHGDYRLDNMMFSDDPQDPVAVVDWQMVSQGPPSGDLSYFLGAGLTHEDRRAHEETLVTGYHRSLISAGVENYTLDECWDGYRRSAFGGLVMAVVASQIVVVTDRGDEMFLTMARRHATQALDLDSESLI